LTGDHGIDVAVAVDLVMLRRGLTADEAYKLMRLGAEESGGDLHSVASDVIDAGASHLPVPAGALPQGD
jgi:AmiR/NasT family two-component response regulator